MPSVQEIITPAVAVLGLGLSIYNTMQARRDKRPKLRVNVSFGFLAFGPRLSDQKTFFEVGNGWNQPVTLASLCMPLPGKRSMAYPTTGWRNADAGCPHAWAIDEVLDELG